jgi:hypothetical protein
MRQITINGQVFNEEINSYTYNIGNYLRILVGLGKVVNDVFVFDLPQQYETIIVQNEQGLTNQMTGEVVKPSITDFSDFEAKYPNGSFATEDLWEYVDLIRSRG